MSGLTSMGLSTASLISGRQRASVEAVIVYHLMTSLTNRLQNVNLYKSFTDTEMPSLIILAKMELIGIGTILILTIIFTSAV